MGGQSSTPTLDEAERVILAELADAKVSRKRKREAADAVGEMEDTLAEEDSLTVKDRQRIREMMWRTWSGANS